MTEQQLFSPFPDDARLWIYAADRPLDAGEQGALKRHLEQLLDGWASHGRPVTGAVDVLHDRFLLLAAYIPGGDISGCGIDASVRAVEEAGRQAGITWLSPLQVFYRDAEGAVRAAGRGAFRQHVASGDVSAATPVFDVSLTTLGDLRSRGFERPAGSSWHARVFRIPAEAETARSS